jgi:hypothetical protein
LDDPAASGLRAAAREGGADGLSRAALSEHDDEGGFTREVADTIARLQREGASLLREDA